MSADQNFGWDLETELILASVEAPRGPYDKIVLESGPNDTVRMTFYNNGAQIFKDEGLETSGDDLMGTATILAWHVRGLTVFARTKKARAKRNSDPLSRLFGDN
jgi:hypothetical protein